MRDLVWTLIGIWLIYKLVDIFKTASANKREASYNGTYSNTTEQNSAGTKTASRKNLNTEGEYVDFEEIK